MNQTKSESGSSSGALGGPFRTYVLAAWLLAKVPLCLLIASSTAFGAVLAPDFSGLETLLLGGGVMLVAMGGATVNSLQERHIDRQFKRTSSRPLPQNVVSGRFAMVQAISLVTVGLILLTRTDAAPITVAGLSVFSLFLYNVVYTRLKQKTILAIVPGAICGALPPVIGWLGAGGYLYSYMSLLLLMLLFLWQVPHFCLVLLLHKDDYLSARQPSFIKLFAEKGVRRVSAVWILGLSLIMMLFSISSVKFPSWLLLLLIVNAITLAGVSGYQLLARRHASYRMLFIFFNVMLGNHMLIVTIGRMWN